MDGKTDLAVFEMTSDSVPALDHPGIVSIRCKDGIASVICEGWVDEIKGSVSRRECNDSDLNSDPAWSEDDFVPIPLK